jgi:hypothetical protein
MDSYIYLISEIEPTRGRLRRLLESVSEAKEIGKSRAIAQRAGPNLEANTWCFCCVIVFAGVLMAAQWPRHLFWLMVWPAPMALICTIFVFVRQGFYFENGVLVLGRRVNPKR